LSPDREPSLKELAEISEFAKKNNVKYIFFETLVSPKLAETVAREVGAQTLVLDPLEGLTSSEISEGKTYLTVMRENLHNLRTALECL
jgi:zinc transport system substrate-binding protein